MKRDILPLGVRAGGITEQAAQWTGLNVGTAVAVANVDAHVSVPAATVTEGGRMVMIMGTSICHMVLGETEEIVPGMCGVVMDGILPNKPGFEAGQSCVGDHFQWFTETCVPEAYENEARQQGISIHQLLEERAAALETGRERFTGTGLVEWQSLNIGGCRSDRYDAGDDAVDQT